MTDPSIRYRSIDPLIDESSDQHPATASSNKDKPPPPRNEATMPPLCLLNGSRDEMMVLRFSLEAELSNAFAAQLSSIECMHKTAARPQCAIPAVEAKCPPFQPLLLPLLCEKPDRGVGTEPFTPVPAGGVLVLFARPVVFCCCTF